MNKLTIFEVLSQAIESHKREDLESAEQLYTAVLKEFPRHHDALHNLGILKKQTGDIETAVLLLSKALKEQPDVIQFWEDYITTTFEAGKFELCWPKLAEFEELNFQDTRGFKLIEMYKIKLQQAENLEKKELNAIQRNNLNKIAKSSNFDALHLQYLKLIDENPKVVSVHVTMAYIAFNAKKFKIAMQYLRTCLRIDPKHSEAFYIAGTILLNEGKYYEAASVLRHSLRLEQKAACMNNLGICLQELGETESAVQMHVKSLEIQQTDPKTYNNLGNCYVLLGNYQKALDCFERSLALEKSFHTLFNMGVAQENLGNLDLAREYYSKTIEIQPKFTKAHRELSKHTDYKTNNKHLDEMLVLRDQIKDPLALSELYFGIAAAFHCKENYLEAFDAYNRANKIKYELLRHDFSTDYKNLSRFKDTIINASSSRIMNSNEQTKTPIFVIGMPRSGTTLVEQIISNHSDVYGAGELPYLERAFKEHVKLFPIVNLKNLKFLRESYLSNLEKLGTAAERFVVDKTPQNFVFVDFIVNCFPEAKIVHIKRDARATCWSNYTHNFASGLNYSFNLENTVNYYKLYEDIMKKWKKIHTERIIEVSYEQLVTNPEVHIRSLLKALELSWQDGCLKPHENRRAVQTASLKQVREEIYTGSSRAWELYKPFVGKIFSQLQ